MDDERLSEINERINIEEMLDKSVFTLLFYLNNMPPGSTTRVRNILRRQVGLNGTIGDFINLIIRGGRKIKRKDIRIIMLSPLNLTTKITAYIMDALDKAGLVDYINGKLSEIEQ